MSAPVPGRPEPDDRVQSGDRAALEADQAAQAADAAAMAATRADDAAAQAAQAALRAAAVDSGGGTADVVVVPVEVPVAVPVPVEPGQPWTGTVIDAVPTTADEIAALVLSIPGVTRLHAGRFGEVATYLPGRRVTGVKVGDDLIEVHVVVAGQVPVRQTAQAIHEAVATLVAVPVHVYVEDIASA